MRQGMEYGLKLNMHVYNNLIHAAILDNDLMKAYCWPPPLYIYIYPDFSANSLVLGVSILS